MKLETDDVKKGKYIGQELWICDYRYNDFSNKPVRRIPPTKVICLSIEDTDKRVNYSLCFFREGEKKSSLIKLFDNTGYRSFPGVPLQVFTEEKECIEAYNLAKEKLREEFKEYKKQQLDSLSKLEKLLQ